MSDLRIAFMGTGLIAAKCLESATKAAGCTVTHIASRTRERAETFIADQAALLPNGAHPITYDELAAADDVDAVYISLPNHLHVGWSLTLLEAGKHVLCEKPLTPHRAEAERVVETARRKNRVWQEAFMYPHHPQTDRLREITHAALHDPANSPIGELRLLRADAVVDLGDGTHVEHRLRHSTQGGALQDVGVYPMGCVRYLTGLEPDPGSIRATARPARIPEGESHPVDGLLVWSFTVADGRVPVQCSTALDTWAGHGLELAGTTGRLSTARPYWPDDHRAVLDLAHRDAEPTEIVIEDGGDRVEHQFAHFASACRGDGPIIPSWDWSIGMAAAIEDTYAALEWEPLPPSPAV
ncbi:MAG: Gfo/Idh/MocA family oxidoreductase [Planctomycetota bacterium]